MRTYLLTLAIFLAACLGLVFKAAAELEVSASVSIHAATDFYEPLTPSGAWVEVGSYGRCWHPASVAVGWRPYCNGYWEWTDCGWYWVSDEPWAWACYHYGTWVYESNYGWVWVPGVEWAPAWVIWRTGGDHIGWAPCGPARFVVEPSFFVFVENRHFHDRVRPDRVIINNQVIIKNTTEVKSSRREQRQFDGKSQTVVVNEGPRVDVVEKATGKKFAAVSVREADKRTDVAVPEKLKHQSAGASPNEKPRTIQDSKKVSPEKKPETPRNVPKNGSPVEKVVPSETPVPQAPLEKVVPPVKRELPVDQERRHSHEVVPPVQPSLPIQKVPSEKIVPPVNREVPFDKEQRRPAEIVPPPHLPPVNRELPVDRERRHANDVIPAQPPIHPSPVVPSGNQGPHDQGRGQDKDHGHENP